ncbi:MAG TPA: hypothetical protein PKH77_09770 [Anaerolineae bacterium]|nr:hypothetical protein [Anaerolineae bacterium]
MNEQLPQLLAIVKRGDAAEIEGARDLVRPELLPGLLDAYWTLNTWEDKAGLMQLFSDYMAPQGRAVMLDFLTAPTTALNEEYFISGKIVALCQLAGTFELYERCWYNRPLCLAVIERVLAGATPNRALLDELDPQSAPAATTSPKSQKKWWQFWK